MDKDKKSTFKKIKVFFKKFHITTTLIILSIYFLLVFISWIVLKNTGLFLL